MLFILYGGALDIGKVSREYFDRCGIPTISKSYYRKEDSVITHRLEEKRFTTDREISECDFYYELNGLNVGFNKSQIIDAVQGKTDLLLTMSATKIDFIKQIKKAYGDYVTVIFSYTDHTTLLELTKREKEISEEEVAARMKVARQIKEVYLNHQTLFDEVILYADDGVYTYENLSVQYEGIIKRHKEIERQLNNKRYVGLPYTGTKPYLFVSYSHEDTTEVYAILSMLQRNGFRVWYDEGITGGSNWREILKNKIKSSAMVLLFSSAHAAESRAVSKEITTAEIFEIPILTVMLDHAVFASIDEEVLSGKQKLKSFESGFEEKLIRALPEKTDTNLVE